MEMFRTIGQIQKRLRTLATRTGEVFKLMNEWYEDYSEFENTDVLAPLVGSSGIERVNIIIQRTFAPFTFAGSVSGGPSSANSPGSPLSNNSSQPNAGSGSSPSSAATSGGGTGAASSASLTSSAAHTVETVIIEVHRRANFNLVGGVMVIRIPSKSFSVQPQVATAKTVTVGGTTSTVYPAMCNGGGPVNIPAANGAPSTPFYCATVTQTSNWQVAGMLGAVWFPAGRDYFPRGTSGSLHPRNFIPGFLVATAVTSLGNALIGPDFEPVNGIDFYVGIASAHQTSLPNSLPLSTVLLPVGSNNSPPTLPTVTHLKAGLGIGVGFDLSIFSTLFGKTTAAGLP